MANAGSISTLERAALLRRMDSEQFDLAVIGGGITGAGLAFEAARRGLSVAVLEAHDFAAGTSSRSTKLIHGGLRYLAMGDVRLVRETARERKEIFRIAAHLAEPRWMVLPVRSRAALLKFRIAIASYEKLGGVAPRDRHRSWRASDLESEEPAIERARYPYACAYREYLTDDARLVLANLRGAAARGATVLNHSPVTALIEEGGRVAGVEAHCAFSGATVRVRSLSVVNAAGPWVESVCRFETTGAPDWLTLSQGIHVTLPAERLPLRNPIMLQTPDRRIVFAIPRKEITYLGTTDTLHRGGPRLWPEIRAEDVAYLLEPAARYFSVGPLGPTDVIGAWAGLRPLIAKPGKAPRDLSRKEEIRVGPKGLVSIAGGKLTGYRAMAHNVLERVADALGRALPEPEGDDRLPGGDFDGDLDRLSAELAASSGLAPECLRPIARRYGSEAEQVLRRGAEPLAPGAPLFCGEIDWAMREEGAATVEDVLYRRNRAAVFAPRSACALAEPVADRMAVALGWTTERRARELERIRRRLVADLGFRDR